MHQHQTYRERGVQDWELMSTPVRFSPPGVEAYYGCFSFLFFFNIYFCDCSTHYSWDLGSPARDKPSPPALQVQSLNHWTSWEVPKNCFIFLEQF